MKKRLVSAAVTVALFIGLIAGVTFKSSDKKEIKHFTAFFSVEGDNIDPDNDIKQLIAEQIGAECEETWLVGQDKDDAINSLIATGEYPDFVLGETALYEADALIPIDEYWDDYPNIKEYLSDEQWEKLRQPDGHIYWIPQFGVSHGDDVEMLHNGEAFWIQTRVLKWAGYPKIKPRLLPDFVRYECFDRHFNRYGIMQHKLPQHPRQLPASCNNCLPKRGDRAKPAVFGSDCQDAGRQQRGQDISGGGR